MKRIDLERMKSDYIGKQFNWLTVLDVYKNIEKGRYFFKCKCKCGNEIDLQYNGVISGHTKSCGCYRFSKDFSNSLSEYWNNNPEKVKEKTDKYTQWIKENQNKLAERSKKRLQFYKDNPDVLERSIEKRKQTLANNVSIQESINTKIKDSWTDEKRTEFSEYRKQYYIDHPELREIQSSRVSQFYKDSPEKKLELSEKIKKFREENPDVVNHQIELHKQWFNNNRQKVIEQAANLSDLSEDRRHLQLHSATESDNFQLLLDAIHPSLIDKLLSGSIKSNDSILTRCQCVVIIAAIYLVTFGGYIAVILELAHCQRADNVDIL